MISYHKTNGITIFKTHANVNHAIITKKIEEVNNSLRETIYRQPTKKLPKLLGGQIKILFLQGSFQK